MIAPPASTTDRFHWRSELLLLTLTIAETAVVWLIADLILLAARDDGARLPWWPTTLLILTATFLPRFLEAFDVWEPTYGVAILVAVAATTLIAIKTASYAAWSWSDGAWLRDAMRALVVRPHAAEVSIWGLIMLSAFAWWRGKTRAEPGIDAATMTLRVGTVVTLAAAAAEAIVRSTGSARPTSAAVALFFVAALTAIAFARARAGGEHPAVASRARWLASLLAPVAVVAATAVLAVGIVTRDLFDTLLWALAPFVWALSVVFRLLVLLLAVVAFIVVSPILWLLARHPIRVGNLRWDPGRADRASPVQEVTERAAAIPDPIRYLVALAVIALLFSGIARLVLRRRRRLVEVDDEERDSVLGAELSRLLTSLLRSVRGRRAAKPIDPLAALRGDPRWRHTVVIRETYARFLAWSMLHGQPRLPAVTPTEHASRLAPRGETAPLPDAISTLTARYNPIRYGALPATADEAEAATRAWRAVQNEGAARDRGV